MANWSGHERATPQIPTAIRRLALPDLAQWVGFYGGYDQIPASAWAEWDRLYEVRQRMQKLSARGRRANNGAGHGLNTGARSSSHLRKTRPRAS